MQLSLFIVPPPLGGKRLKPSLLDEQVENERRESWLSYMLKRERIK